MEMTESSSGDFREITLVLSGHFIFLTLFIMRKVPYIEVDHRRGGFSGSDIKTSDF